MRSRTTSAGCRAWPRPVNRGDDRRGRSAPGRMRRAVGAPLHHFRRGAMKWAAGGVTQSLGSPFGAGIAVPGTGVVLNNFLNWGELHPELHVPAPLTRCRSTPRRDDPPGAPALPVAPSVTTRARRAAAGARRWAPGRARHLPITTQVLACSRPSRMGVDRNGRAAGHRGSSRGPGRWDGAALNRSSRGSVRRDARRATRRRRCISRGRCTTAWLRPFTNYVGGMQGVARDPSTGVMTGGADPRRDGYAAGL